jgi:hypothetical protein
MGYNIEVSFNTLKHNCVTQTRDMIINYAQENGCNYWYENYEFINTINHNRNHTIITINFQNTNINKIVNFLKIIKVIKGLNIETIYDDINNQLLFASKYYLTQMMDKHLAKEFKSNKRERSYSEDDTIIINTISNDKK